MSESIKTELFSQEDNPDREKLEEMKVWFFKENIRLNALRQELEQREEELEKKEKTLSAEERRISLEDNRLKQNNVFFEKKMQILQDGFRQLDADRRKFEKDKKHHQDKRYEREYFRNSGAEGLYNGVNSLLALKKRYRDLMKIYHPDNLCGDYEMVRRINEEYERLRDEFEYSNIV